MSKYCKECAREIPQNSKRALCENCQNKKNGKVRKIGEGALALASLAVTVGLAVITKGKFGGPKT